MAKRNGSTRRDERTHRGNGHDGRRTPVSQRDVPSIALDVALRVSQAIADNYGFAPTRPLDVAAALEMSPTSGPFKTLCGASIAYGLTEGGYNATEIIVSPLARRILRPTEEGDDERARREAFLTPRVPREFLTRYDGNRLPKPEIAHNVLEQMGVPKDSTQRAFEMIVDGAHAARFLTDIKGALYVNLQGFGPLEAGTVPDQDRVIGDDQKSEQVVHAVTELKPLAGATAAPSAVAIAARAHPGPDATPAPAKNAIFIGHGRNKRPLEQLKQILDHYKIPYRVATDEANRFRPISEKVAEVMKECGAAILIFTADEELRDLAGEPVWRPSENVVHELGAASILYGGRIIIFKEDVVKLPSNFSGIGYIVLRSLQYRRDVVKSLRYFADRDYFLFVHWLNPGYNDRQSYGDDFGIIETLLRFPVADWYPLWEVPC
jgi:hypothetical protein